MRKRRLARLAGLNTNNAAASSSNTTSISPSTPGPSKVFTGSIVSPSIQQLQHVEIPMPLSVQQELQRAEIPISPSIQQQLQHAEIPIPLSIQQQLQRADIPTSPSIQQQLQSVEIPMEVEESSDKQCNTFGVDVDSGIENMEVEESDRKDSIPRSRVSCSYNDRERKIH